MADILISQLPKTEAAGDSDLLIIDSFDTTTGGIVTNAIKWSDLYTKITSFPQGVKFPDGTSLQPSITFVNDTNTGIYRQGDDTIAITTNGLTRLVVNPAGNLGINTLSPEEKIHIQEGNLKVAYGTTNSVLIGAGFGGMGVVQQKALPLILGTNELERLTISGDGRVLIGTTDLDSDSMLRVNGTIQSGSGTLGSVDGKTTIGANTNTTTNLLYLTTDGAIGNKSEAYGTAGQVLTSGGPGNSWYWGAGGGGGGGSGLTPKGEIDVTQPAPGNPQVGDFYINNTSGFTDSSFGFVEYATANAFVIYTESGWVIQDQDLSGYVDITSDQTINGVKTFNETIIGTAQNCSREIEAGKGLTGGGELNKNISITFNAGDGLDIQADSAVVKASDSTIVVDAGGIRVDTSQIFSDDPAVAAGVTSFNGRKGAVIPAADDYSLDQMSDVITSGAEEGQVLTRQGSQWVPKDINVEGALAFVGEINATIVTAPVATPGQFWVQTDADGNVLDDASWGTLRNEPVVEGDMIAKSADIDGQPPQWAIIGNLGGGGVSPINSISAQNGVTNQGNNEDIVLEVDNTVVRTTTPQTIGGVKTFSETIIGDLQGDVTGEATDCSRSVIAGDGLYGGGKLSQNRTLHVKHNDSLAIVSDTLATVAGDGLKSGPDGQGGPLEVDIDWLNDNYTPDVSGEVGNGAIGLAALVDGGCVVTGQNATANQSTGTSWNVGVDNTVVRTSGNQTIGDIKTFNTVKVSYFDFSNLSVLN